MRILLLLGLVLSLASCNTFSSKEEKCDKDTTNVKACILTERISIDTLFKRDVTVIAGTTKLIISKIDTGNTFNISVQKNLAVEISNSDSIKAKADSVQSKKESEKE